MLDEGLETSDPGGFLLGADHPADHQPAVSGGLGFEVAPGLRVRPEARLVLGRELRRIPTAQPATRLLGIARLESPQTSGLHSPAADELFGASSVDRAPAAPLAARGEADHVALLVQGAPNPIDPPETEGLVDRFRPGDAGSPRALLIEADPQLSRGVVVLGQPPSKIIRG